LQLRPLKAQFDITGKCHSLCHGVEISFQDGQFGQNGQLGGAFFYATPGKIFIPNGGLDGQFQ
jgi:hypothetical protein